MPDTIHTESIILFDGVCNLCNASVQFIIKRDKFNRFKFAPLQSDFGVALLNKYKLDATLIDSVILIENNQVYVKSTGALKVARQLKGFWPLLYGFIIVPTLIRDKVYDIIAKNRYKWFGKKDKCMVPTKELKDKFIVTN